MKIQITFQNCKSEEILEQYVADMVNSGAEIAETYLNTLPDGTSELGFVVAYIEDIKKFLLKFDFTQSEEHLRNLYILPENPETPAKNESLS